MQGLANSVPIDSHGGTVAGVRQVAPPSGISTASAYPPVHAGATHYQPYPEASLQALGAAPSTFVSTQPDMHNLVPFQPIASSTVLPSPQQPHVQQQMMQQQYGQLHQQQVQLQQSSQQLPTPQVQQAQQRPTGLPASIHMNGHMQARPQQQARPPYPGQPGEYTQLRPGAGVGRPPSVAAAAAAQQQQMRPQALAPVTPRRVSPMPFKLIAPNSAVRTIPATVQARLSVGSLAPRGPVPAPGASPRPQLVMGVPAGGRGALQMATGVPVPSAGAPGTAAPGRPMMRPASQPQVIVSTAADISMQGQSHPAYQAKPTSTTPPPVVGPETPQIFPGVPLAAVAAQPASPQPQLHSATPPAPQPQPAPLSPPQPVPSQPPSVQPPQVPVHTAAPVAAHPPKQPTALASAQSVAPQPGPPAVSSTAAEPGQSSSPPEQEQDEVMDFLNDEEEVDVVGSPVKEKRAEKGAEQKAADSPKPASSASASKHVDGSRTVVPPTQSAKSEPEADAAADGATVTGSAAPSVAPSVTAAKSSSGEATGDRSGGKGTVTGSDGGSGAVPAPGPAPLIIRDWGSAGGGFVPFGASVQKTAPKGGKVLPQGSVKAKPSAAIGAALGPHLVLPNGNVSGPRACAPVEAFELPGSIAKAAAVPPAPPTAAAATPFDYHPALASASFASPGAAAALRPAGPAASSPGRATLVKPPIVPKPKIKPRPLFDGEERKRGPAGRTSMYKGVTKHRRSGRWEAHVWVREDGKQAYLGGYSTEEEAAEAHDVAALKCHGLKAKTNFHISRYTALLDRLDSVPMNELVMAIRRTSPGFTRGSSSFRGVTQHKSGRWEVRIGLRGSKHVYLGLHSSEVEAARVYDRALVLLTGSSAATNFPVSNYTKELEAYQKRIDNGEQLPGFHNDGEYSEHAFEAWLRDAAIMPAPVPGTNNTRIVDSNTGASPADAEAAQAQAVEEPKPKPTKPKRRRIATAALGGGVIDEGSEAAPRAALADNGSPRPTVKRRRTSHIGRPNKQSQHVHDGMLDLSQVGKPKQGRPGPRRKAEAAESDTAAILMQMATVAEGLGRSHPGKRSPLPTWGRSSALLVDEDMEEEDVEISDDDEPMPQLTTRRRRGTNARSSRLGNPAIYGKLAAAKTPPSITQHRFTLPAALLEAIDDTETSKSQILQALFPVKAKAGKPGASEAAVQQKSLALQDFVMWLGLVSAVGRLAHGMLTVISSAPANP